MAQTAIEASSTVTTYPASFFESSRTYTALDMLELIPGYTFTDSEAEVRGLANASGNALLDGSRPASKYGSLEALLRRIPADCVERIELIRPGTPSVDMQGNVVLANVVRGRCAGTRGSVEIRDAFYERDYAAPGVAAEMTHRGDRLLELSTEIHQTVDDEHGAGKRPRVSAQGKMLRDGPYSQDEGERIAALAAGYEDTFFAGKLRLSGTTQRIRFHADIVDQTAESLDGTVVGVEFNDETQTELGMQFQRALNAATQLELSALDRSARERGGEREISANESTFFLDDSDSDETILRALVRHSRGRLALEGSLEVAHNSLDSRARLTENGAAVPLPNSNAYVEERRGETTLAATFTLNRRWNMELGSRFEYSELAYRADTRLAKTFFFPKPRALLTWSSGSNRIEGLIERRVGQLDFDDFASSASLTTGTVTAGNADLEPDRALRLQVSWQRRVSDRSDFTVSARHEIVDHLIDRIPVFAGEVYDAIGNIGSGTRDELEIEATILLEAIGVPGGILKPSAAWRRSKTTDPVTGRSRTISDDAPFEGNVHFVQPLPRWKSRWGIDIFFASEEREYRFDEVRTDRLGTLCNVFVEYQPHPLWNVRAFVNNLLNRTAERRREVYDGPRGNAPLLYVETRTLGVGPYAGVQIRREFGK